MVSSLMSQDTWKWWLDRLLIRVHDYSTNQSKENLNHLLETIADITEELVRNEIDD